MPNINITVADKIATNMSPGVAIVCGNSDYTVTFTFDAEWAAQPIKTARFVFTRDGKVQYTEVAFSGTVAAVPVLSGVLEVFVGVYAGDLHTTTPARVLCDRSILCGGGTHEAPPEDIYNQILAACNEIAGASVEHLADKNNPHGVTAAQVGATPASHAEDKNNPHGVTAAQVGAAPANSVGTNKVFNKLTDIGITSFPTTMETVANAMPDNSTLMIDSRDIISGMPNEITDLGLNNSGMYMFMRGNNAHRLTMLHIYAATSSTTSFLNYGCYAFTTKQVIWVLGERQHATYTDCRYRIAADGETEWINPPMVTGVEYRTTERFNGKPVYVKAVDFGALPNADVAAVAHGVSNVENILSCIGTLSNGSSLPYAGTDYNMYCQSNKTKISVVTTSDASSFTATITIKYTKTTD